LDIRKRIIQVADIMKEYADDPSKSDATLFMVVRGLLGSCLLRYLPERDHDLQSRLFLAACGDRDGLAQRN
jgi:hypothetical protein